jgi:PAS domain S-box-containing protein
VAAKPEPLDLLDAFERSGDGVYAVDYNQKIVFWNDAAERLLGHKASEVLGAQCFDVIAGGDHLGHPFCGADCEVIKCSRKGKAPANYDVRTKTAGGEGRWLNISIIVLVGSRKRSTLTVHLARDITEERRRQLMLSRGEAGDAGTESAVGLAKLTRRESDVLQYLSCGMSNAQIAELLGVSATTVRNHTEHLLAKLGVHSKLEAVVMAARNRLV